jgi:16S rRNA (cytosine967-C5)-methyltransferase
MQADSMNYGKHPWVEAVSLVQRWLEHGERSDELLEQAASDLDAVGRARVQNLVWGVLRNHIRVARLLEKRLSHPPRELVLAILHVAGFEMIEAQTGPDAAGTYPKIVHHAVEQSKHLVSRAEEKLVNAVLRRLSEDISAQTVPPALAQSHILASYYSHPEWLVKRWQAVFGAKPTRALLDWNQSPGAVYLRRRPGFEGELPAVLKTTQWADFYMVEPGHWRDVSKLVQEGQFYAQDPSTRLSIDLLNPQAGEWVLDLCAAPGGKSLACADRMGTGHLVAIDLPGERLGRLRENLARIRGVEARLVEADLQANLSMALQAAKLPAGYAAVMLDAPCSNTGVMRHRVDVKDRLEESDMAKHATQQLRLLRAASKHVLPGGRLVYSTCSIDPEENEQVVVAFLKDAPAFTLEDKRLGRPWEHGHDGAAAFLLRRAK